MSRQLEAWRAGLPKILQWLEEDVSNTDNDIPDVDTSGPRVLSIADTQVVSLSVLTSELRTRYYFARFILYRPFIFKALHFPTLMNSHDSSSCAYALKSACLWPITMAPAKNFKRFIPHLFTWTQNFIGILMILWMTQHNDCLSQIASNYLDQDSVNNTIRLTLHWIDDVKQMDGIAEWSWQLLEPLFPQRS